MCNGLLRALGSDLWWGWYLATLVGDRETGEWMIVFPFLSGEVVIGQTTADLSGN